MKKLKKFLLACFMEMFSPLKNFNIFYAEIQIKHICKSGTDMF